MTFYKRNPDPRQKPPLGSVLNPDHPLAQGLVGCWLMNEGGGSKIYDLTGNTNGTLMDVSWSSTEYGSALYFNGSTSKVDLGWEYAPQMPATLTVIAKRIGLTGLSQGLLTTDELSFGSGTFPHSGMWLNLPVNADRIGVGYGSASGICGSGSRRSYAVTTIKYTEGLLTGIIRAALDMDIVYDGQVLSGDYSGTGGNLGYSSSTNMHAGIGAYSECADSSLYPFYGYIVAAFIHERALTIDEVQWLHAEPYSMILQPKYWHMVDFGAAGGATYYLSASGSMGSLTGTATRKGLFKRTVEGSI